MKTKVITLCLLASTMLIGFSSCTSLAPKGPQTVEGEVLDATMNNICLLTTKGDTLEISTMDSDPTKVPGVLIQDSVKITYTETKTDNNTILSATELSVIKHSPYFFIAGSWVEPNPIDPKQMQGMTLNPDGTATSINMATLLTEKWNMEDGKLIISIKSIGNKQTIEMNDTMKVIKLDADSLILERGSEVWALSREKK